MEIIKNKIIWSAAAIALIVIVMFLPSNLNSNPIAKQVKNEYATFADLTGVGLGKYKIDIDDARTLHDISTPTKEYKYSKGFATSYAVNIGSDIGNCEIYTYIDKNDNFVYLFVPRSSPMADLQYIFCAKADSDIYLYQLRADDKFIKDKCNFAGTKNGPEIAEIFGL
ncbi:MAG: hypothetical protein FWE47_03505 [Oscillospiraceae bacterium]|nr:hypothetical protein [Oscillospiraceae bacterium]